jgi:hypothetical protein
VIHRRSSTIDAVSQGLLTEMPFFGTAGLISRSVTAAIVAGAGRDARYVVDRVAERVAAPRRNHSLAAAAAAAR